MPIPGAGELLAYERSIWEKGYTLIAGIDEAGRGPLAGPVVSACVVFPPSFFLEGVYDSKAVPADKMETLYGKIISSCVCWAVGMADHQEIDQINIYQAAKLSMMRALEGLSVRPDYVLVDAMKLDASSPVESIIKGDQKSFTIAAASIIAKVTRDRLMRKLHEEYPQYGWDRNKGYPTEEHREAVKKHGFSPYHRRTFSVK